MAGLGMPLAQERLIDVDRNGVARPTRAWYLFWQKLSQQAAAGGVSPADFSALLIYLGSSDGTLAGLPPFNPGGGLPANANVLGSQSVETTGALSAGIVLVNLVNDVDLPAPTTYYGADGAGEKGWFPIADAFAAQPEITLTVGVDGVTTISITPVPDSGAGALLAITRNGLGQVTGTRPATITGTAGRITVANGDASAGLPTVDLATVPNAGGGTLQKTAFDGWGRATGYSAATTDDLPEGGSNQWFTVERAQDATGAMVANSTNVTLTYNDATPSLIADLTNTTVAAGSYGDARHVATFTVDAKGRLTATGIKPVSTFDSTGLITGGALSINAGNNARFDVAAGQAVFIDHTNPAEPDQVLVSFGPFSAVVVTSLATQLVTYVGIDAAGAIVQSIAPFSDTQRRTIVSLGVVVHSNHTIINAVNVVAATARAGVNQLHDLIEAVGPLNLTGNVFSPNGANLLLNRSAGRIFKFGSNFQASVNDPHVVSLASATGLTFRYRLSNGTEFADRTAIDPLQYESSPGTLSTVPLLLTPVSVQRITIFQSGLCRIQYGQQVYASIAAAESSLLTDPFVTETNIAENGIFRCFLIVNRGASNLGAAAQAKFVHVSKFGATASGGISAATTDDLAEGTTNLYFTNERAQDAVGTILTNSPSVLFTYDDAGNKITAEAPQWIFGQEYLYAFHQKLIAGTSASMLFSGDSTTFGTSISNSNFLLHTAVLRVGRSRRHVLSATNAGHSGASTEDWRTTYVAGDVAANPDLMVLRWGLNDPFYGRNLAQFETSLRAGLTTIRSSKTVGQMSVVLMTPSTANDPPNGRTPAWIESTRAVIRKAARDFQCVFIDTFKLWEDTVNASGNWMDNPFGDGRPIHPLEAMNGWIASKVAEVIFPAALDPTKTAVLATLSADTTYSTGAFSTIVFNTEAEDARGEYNPATGVFTCQQAGKYLVSASAYFDANAENRSVILSASVNGSEAARLCEVPYYGAVATTGGMAGNTTTLTLAAGDQLRVQSFVFSSSGGTTYKVKNFAFATFLKINRLD